MLNARCSEKGWQDDATPDAKPTGGIGNAGWRSGSTYCVIAQDDRAGTFNLLLHGPAANG